MPATAQAGSVEMSPYHEDIETLREVLAEMDPRSPLMDRLEDVIESMENGYFDEHFMYAIRSMERGNSHRLPLRVPIRLTGESEKIGYIEIARDGSLPETVEKNHRFYRRRDGEPTHALPVYEPSLIAKVS